MQPSVADTEHT